MHSSTLLIDASPLSDLKRDQPLAACCAQEIMAALMLQHRDRLTMHHALDDLLAHPQWWEAFCLGVDLPTQDTIAEVGTLACLRDLVMCWNVDTLYILARTADAARSLAAIAPQWECSEIVVHAAKRTQRLVGSRGKQRLVTMRWEYPVRDASKDNFAGLYQREEAVADIGDMSRSLEKCSTQQLLTGLLLKTAADRLPAARVVEDLRMNPQWWRSFLLGPPLPNVKTGIDRRLEVLQLLPQHWGGSCLYIWSEDQTAAVALQAMSQHWGKATVEIIAGAGAARLLGIPDAPPIVVVTWQ